MSTLISCVGTSGGKVQYVPTLPSAHQIVWYLLYTAILGSHLHRLHGSLVPRSFTAGRPNQHATQAKGHR
jgi:hypothetical protein